MIVGSLLLILVAVVLLVVGLASGSSVLLISSIAASLLAAVALVVGARQAAAARAEAGPADAGRTVRDGHDRSGVPRGAAGQGGDTSTRRPAWTGVPSSQGTSPVAVAEPEQAEAPPQGRTATAHAYPDGPPGAPVGTSATPGQPGAADAAPDDPPDEPAPQPVTPGDAARVARMNTEVLVIDGRPRYHLAGCVHLLGRQGEALPVSEAVELGFTPCGLCEPDSRLIADARRA